MLGKTVSRSSDRPQTSGAHNGEVLEGLLGLSPGDVATQCASRRARNRQVLSPVIPLGHCSGTIAGVASGYLSERPNNNNSRGVAMRVHVLPQQASSCPWAFMLVLALPFMAMSATAQVCSNPYPGPAESYLIDQAASDVAIGDFNGDVHRDLAVANDGENTISVYLNYGDGTFYRIPDSPAGGSPASLQVSRIAIGEIDEAWGSDIVATHADVDRISIEERAPQLGVGRFARASSYAAGESPSEVAVADMDGDGHLDAVSIAPGEPVKDLVLGNLTQRYVESLRLFLNNPGAIGSLDPLPIGPLEPWSIYEDGAAPSDFSLVDLDDDQRLDIVYVARSSLNALHNEPGNSSHPRIDFDNVNMYSQRLGRPLPFEAAAIAAAKVDSDFRPDIVVASAVDDSVLVFSGTGDLSGIPLSTKALAPPIVLSKGNSLPTPPGGLLIEDVDGDSRADIIALNQGGAGGLVVFRGTAGGFAAPVSSGTGIQVSGIAAAKLNGDSGVDLALAEPRGVVSLLFNGCAIPDFNVRIRDIEAVQVIQDLAPDLSARVPLVADKETFVRVHVEASRRADPMSARLVAYRNTGERINDVPLRPENAGGKIEVPIAPERSRLADTFNFRLPSAWTTAGGIRIRVELDAPAIDAVAADNAAEQVLTFNDTAKLKVRLIKFRWKDAGGTWHEPTDDEMAKIKSNLRRIMPTGKVVIETPPTFEDPGPFQYLTAAAILYKDGDDSMEVIQRYLATNPGGVGPGAFTVLVAERKLMGGVAPLASHLDPGTTYAANWIASSGVNEDTPAHEIGHLLGRAHASCTTSDQDEAGPDPLFPYTDVNGKDIAQIGEEPGRPGGRYYGLDPGDLSLSPPTLLKVMPPETGDMMSYCDPSWASRYTYIGMRDRIQTTFAGVDPQGNFLQATGIIRTTGSGSSITATRFDQVVAMPVSVPGTYTLRLLSGSGAVLASRAFAPAPLSETDQLLFMAEMVDFVPGTRRVSVLGPGGTEIASAAVSASAPTVTLSPVTGPLPATGSLPLSWSMGDADGGTLTASVLYSTDDGATWHALQTGLTGTSTTLDLGALPGTHGAATARIRVVVNDGVNTAYAQTAGLIAAGKPPSARITSIADAATFTLGQTVTLAASFSDLEDGSLGSIDWRSDVDGPLGTGSLIAPALSEGVHLVIARATDSDEQVGEDSRVVYVERAPPPGSPPVGDAGADRAATEGDTLVLDAYGSSDTDQDPLLYGWTVLEQPAVPLGNGVVLEGDPARPSFVAKENGDYRFQLTVSDQRHGSDDDTVAVAVANAPPVVQVASPADDSVFPKGPVTIIADFGDRGLLDTHTCLVQWDVAAAGAVDVGAVTQASGGGTCRARRELPAGVYQARVTVTDDEGAAGSADVGFVVYDPSAGFVTAGGFIPSPAGAYGAAPAAAGRADVGLVAKYQRTSKSVPTGEFNFDLPAANLRIRSSTYDWIAVTTDRATLRGRAQVNGESGFMFQLTAVDGQLNSTSIDSFRLRVWNATTGATIYDNGTLATFSGSVVIHK